MEENNQESYLFDFFEDLPRQGPGSPDLTRSALRVIDSLSPQSRILDIGCGTGAQTEVIGEETHARVIALDIRISYIHHLLRTRILNRIYGIAGSMLDLPFMPGSFDLIWCEGAAYILGLEGALREWNRYLKPCGFIMISEAVWWTSNPSQEIRAFWDREYPSIGTVESNITLATNLGYTVLATLRLPSEVWWSSIYTPLEEKVYRVLPGSKDEGEMAFLYKILEEIDMFRNYHEEYGYVYFVLRSNR
ncbi:MAG TPA: class I SAM-dependent methyltransferase [Thermoanaerobaculia bacterium]|nr:class I SAM-dependent methyltransferase [Thermoanaerobaculia bacterium]HUM31075.1 class I SAM-dependent methyltransferase [Thermoanaerobaculia bacterium]HXK69413.1 class I SAM-dependent methyltransferase [Thermoanaerobaculia bacterium]